MNRHPKILQRENTALLIVDIQEKILPVISNSELVLQNSIKLIKGCQTLKVPIYFTEQYPKGLGPTQSTILELLGETEAIQKLTFSCVGAVGLFSELEKRSIKKIILIGIESHVCVLQTALDLMQNGFEVFLPYDAVSSRRTADFENAIQRMSKHGAEIISTESALFEMLNVCGTDEFKTISKIVK